jgi:hypothetical protein
MPTFHTNTLTTVIPTILAQGLLALRNACVMPRLVNTDYSADAKQKGDTIDVPIPSAVTVADVDPGPYANDPTGSVPTKAQIPLSYWREAAFFLTDQDIAKAIAGIIPMQASEAIAALADDVNAKIFALYAKIYGYAGTAGTTPFASDISAATAVRKVLSQQKAPIGQRSMVLDVDAEANALGLRAFQDASFRGDQAGITEGQVGRKLGFDFFSDQAVPTHTAGTASGATTNSAGYALGVKTITLASAGTGTILVGDVITFAGDTQTYTVTAGDTDVSGGGTVSFEPGLKVAIATSPAAITVKASHVVNLGFHRDCFALAVRTLDGGAITDSDRQSMMTAVDPVSRLALRLEVRREHKRVRWSYDILYGVGCVRPELGCRLAG